MKNVATKLKAVGSYYVAFMLEGGVIAIHSVDCSDSSSGGIVSTIILAFQDGRVLRLPRGNPYARDLVPSEELVCLGKALDYAEEERAATLYETFSAKPDLKVLRFSPIHGDLEDFDMQCQKRIACIEHNVPYGTVLAGNLVRGLDGKFYRGSTEVRPDLVGEFVEPVNALVPRPKAVYPHLTIRIRQAEPVKKVWSYFKEENITYVQRGSGQFCSCGTVGMVQAGCTLPERLLAQDRQWSISGSMAMIGG